MDYARLSNNTDGLIGPDLYGFCLYLFFNDILFLYNYKSTLGKSNSSDNCYHERSLIIRTSKSSFGKRIYLIIEDTL